jgi:hypothetical protein
MATYNIRTTYKRGEVGKVIGFTCRAADASTGTVAATAADYPVLGGSQVTLTKDGDMDTVSAITASGTTSLHVIPGEGI